MSNWKKLNPCDIASVPNTPCVYCFIHKNVVVYVGSTLRFRSRFYEHNIRYGYAKNIVTPWGSFDDGSVLLKIKPFKKYGDWAMNELRLIKKLKPIFNKTHKNPRGLS